MASTLAQRICNETHEPEKLELILRITAPGTGKNKLQPDRLNQETVDQFYATFFGSANPRCSTVDFITALQPYISRFFLSKRGKEHKKYLDQLKRARSFAQHIVDVQATHVAYMDGHGRFTLLLLEALLSACKSKKITEEHLNGLVFDVVDLNKSVVDYHKQIMFTTAFRHFQKDVLEFAQKKNEPGRRAVYLNFCGVAAAKKMLFTSIRSIVELSEGKVMISFSIARGAQKFDSEIESELVELGLHSTEVAMLKGVFKTLFVESVSSAGAESTDASTERRLQDQAEPQSRGQRAPLPVHAALPAVKPITGKLRIKMPVAPTTLKIRAKLKPALPSTAERVEQG